MCVLPGVFSLEASDVSVESRASDLNFFSGTCSVVWWAGALYFLSVKKTHKAGQKTGTEKWESDSLLKQAYSPQWCVNVHGGYWQVGRDCPSPATLEQVKPTLQTISNQHKATTWSVYYSVSRHFQTSFIFPISYLNKDLASRNLISTNYYYYF